MKKLQIEKAAIVYQGRIANVFSYRGNDPKSAEGRVAQRLIQSGFRACTMFARGLKAAGTEVITLAANVAGDVSLHDWTDNLDAQPFSDQFFMV
jgi:hypothetical protein